MRAPIGIAGGSIISGALTSFSFPYQTGHSAHRQKLHRNRVISIFFPFLPQASDDNKKGTPPPWGRLLGELQLFWQQSYRTPWDSQPNPALNQTCFFPLPLSTPWA